MDHIPTHIKKLKVNYSSAIHGKRPYPSEGEWINLILQKIWILSNLIPMGYFRDLAS